MSQREIVLDKLNTELIRLKIDAAIVGYEGIMANYEHYRDGPARRPRDETRPIDRPMAGLGFG